MTMGKEKKLYLLKEVAGSPKKNIETVSLLGEGVFEMEKSICVDAKEEMNKR